MIKSEIIPRVAGAQTFSNNRIMPHLGAGTRLFLSNWLSFNVAIKDYVFSDKFEPRMRAPGEMIATVKQRAESQLVQKVMIYAGIGIYLPTSFQYRTPR